MRLAPQHRNTTQTAFVQAMASTSLCREWASTTTLSRVLRRKKVKIPGESKDWREVRSETGHQLSYFRKSLTVR